MKNFLESGEFAVIAAMPEAVDSGEFIKVGELSGVAQAAYDSGAEGVLKRQGVFDLPKAAVAFAQGDKLYWDASAKNFTTDSSKTPVRAVAWKAALSGDATSEILIGEGDALRVVGGQLTTATAADTVVTGLSKVLGVVASYDSDPADANTYVSATIGDQAGTPAAGSVIIKTWKQSGTDPTPIAADAFSKKVNWIAFGF